MGIKVGWPLPFDNQADKDTTMRYVIYPIRDWECTELWDDEEVFATNDLTEAYTAASNLSGSFAYGVVIYDLKTNLIDWGFGFGVAVPNNL